MYFNSGIDDMLPALNDLAVCLHYGMHMQTHDVLMSWRHGRRNFKDTNPLLSSSLVIFVGGGEAIL
jgi:hypothetical protein